MSSLTLRVMMDQAAPSGSCFQSIAFPVRSMQAFPIRADEARRAGRASVAEHPSLDPAASTGCRPISMRRRSCNTASSAPIVAALSCRQSSCQRKRPESSIGLLHLLTEPPGIILLHSAQEPWRRARRRTRRTIASKLVHKRRVRRECHIDPKALRPSGRSAAEAQCIDAR